MWKIATNFIILTFACIFLICSQFYTFDYSRKVGSDIIDKSHSFISCLTWDPIKMKVKDLRKV